MKPIRINKYELYFWVLLIATLFIIHFHNTEIFSRELMYHDDLKMIKPLQNVTSINDYLENYLDNKEGDSFPLRDLTYFLDFKLSSLGIQTFWITNLLFFLASLFFINKILKLFFTRALRFFLLSVVALHPVNVEFIQWATSRKHVMVIFFIAWGTYKALKLHLERKAPKNRHWIAFLTLYLCSILSYPIAIFWIFWVMFLFKWRLLKRPLQLLGVIAAIALIVLLQVNVLNFGGMDFAYRIDEPTQKPTLTRYTYFTAMSAGRYAFNMVLPIRLVAYYDPRSAFNYMGYVFLILFLIGFFYLFKKTWKTDENRKAVYSIILAIFLFAPIFFLTMKRVDFVMADRYVPLALPYFLIGAALLANRYLRGRDLHYKYLKIIGGIVLLMYIIISFNLTQYWKDDYTLMAHCADVERSPMCVALSIEKAFDNEGCGLASVHFKDARKIYNTYTKEYQHNAYIDFVTYPAMCVYFNTLNSEQKMNEIQNLYNRYEEKSPIVLSEIFILLEMGESTRAYELAEQTYLEPDFSADDTNIKLINLFRGQSEFLCVIAPNPEECKEKVRVFQFRMSDVKQKEHQTNWAFGQTMDAYNKGVAEKNKRKISTNSTNIQQDSSKQTQS